jgi:hypothetical protein
MTEGQKDLKENNVGIVQAQYFTFDGLMFESGEKFASVTFAAYGT